MPPCLLPSLSLSLTLLSPPLSIFKRSLRNRPPKCSKTPPLCPSHPFIHPSISRSKKDAEKSKIKKRAIQHLNSDVSSREKKTPAMLIIIPCDSSIPCGRGEKLAPVLVVQSRKSWGWWPCICASSNLPRLLSSRLSLTFYVHARSSHVLLVCGEMQACLPRVRHGVRHAIDRFVLLANITR